MVAALRVSRAVLAAPAMRRYLIEEIFPGPAAVIMIAEKGAEMILNSA